MNCESYQNLLSDLIDGTLNPHDQNNVEAHLSTCANCAEARSDLSTLVTFCREHRGEYEDVPHEHALWLRISNTIEGELAAQKPVAVPAGSGWWFRLMNRSWQLSSPQLATTLAAAVVLAVLITFGASRLFSRIGVQTAGLPLGADTMSVQERYRQQAQVIDYWNKRVELNKARWNPQMRETFDRNMGVIDAAVNDSMGRLTQNPHDEVSEDILNAALSDKIALLKEFAEL